MKFVFIVGTILFIAASQQVNGQEEDRKYAEERCENTLCPEGVPPICGALKNRTETFTNYCFMYLANHCDLKPENERWYKIYDGNCTNGK